MTKPSELTKIHIETFPDGTAMMKLDGKDISQIVSRTDIEIAFPAMVRITVEYVCYEQLTLDGVAEIVHVCPKKAR